MKKSNTSKKSILPKGSSVSKYGQSQELTVRNINDPAVKELSNAVLNVVEPLMTATKDAVVNSLGIVQSYLVAELPELANLGDIVKDFVGTAIDSKKKKKDETVRDRQAKDIKIIKKEEVSHSDIFDIMAESLDEISNDIRTLTKITSDVWGVNQEQLEIAKQEIKVLRETEKLEKFRKQKEKATALHAPKLFDIKDSSIKKSWIEKLLTSSNFFNFIFSIIKVIESVIETVFIGSMGKSFLEKLPMGKWLSKIFGPKGAATVATETLGEVAKSSSKLAVFGTTILGSMKVFLKFLGKIAGIFVVIEGLISAARNLYQGWGKGKRGWDLAGFTLKGMFDDIVGGLEKWFTGNTNITDDIAVGMATIYNSISGFIGDVVDSIRSEVNAISDDIKAFIGFTKKVFTKQTYIDAFDKLTNSVKDTIEDLVNKISDAFVSWKDQIITAFTEGIRETLRKIIPENSKVNILGNEVDLVPNELHKFVYPEKQQTPIVASTEKQDVKTIDMLSMQRRIDEYENKTKSVMDTRGNMNNNVINNVTPVNNTIMATPIVTRNPEPLLFGSYLNF